MDVRPLLNQINNYYSKEFSEKSEKIKNYNEYKLNHRLTIQG
jgi:hypothetical protein